jgi:hypothetical protein
MTFEVSFGFRKAEPISMMDAHGILTAQCGEPWLPALAAVENLEREGGTIVRRLVGINGQVVRIHAKPGLPTPPPPAR